MVVLILDDDEDLLHTLTDAIAGEGYQVLAVDRGRQAIRLIRDQVPVDVLLLDVGLPDVDGWTVAKLARRRRPGIPIYMFTGWSVMKKRADEADVNGVLHKPVELGKLLEIFRRHHPPRRDANT